MAVFGLEAKIYSRGKGHSAVAAAAYRAAVRLVDRRTGEVCDFRAKGHVVHSEIAAPAGAPAWTQDRDELWNRAELAETKANSQVAREVLLTLPRELSLDQQIAMVREHVVEEYASKGMVADWSIHMPEASDGGDQPHAHILLTMRELDPTAVSGFVRAKGRGWNADFSSEEAFKKSKSGDRKGAVFVSDAEGLEGLRARWAEMENRHLAKAGVSETVDHRSLENQRQAALANGDFVKAESLRRAPEAKMGPGANARRKKGLECDLADEAMQARADRQNVIDLAAERVRRRQQAYWERRWGREVLTPEQQHEWEQRRERNRQRQAELDREAGRADRHQNGRVDAVVGPARGAEQDGSRVGIAGADPRGAKQVAQGPRAALIAEARANLDRAEAADRYRRFALAHQYKHDVGGLASQVAWMQHRPASGETVVQMKSGGRLRDAGHVIAVQKVDLDAIRLQVQLMKAKGMTEIKLTGSRSYRQAAADLATRAGLVVTNPELKRDVEAARRDIAAKAVTAVRYPMEPVPTPHGAVEQKAAVQGPEKPKRPTLDDRYAKVMLASKQAELELHRASMGRRSNYQRYENAKEEAARLVDLVQRYQAEFRRRELEAAREAERQAAFAALPTTDDLENDDGGRNQYRRPKYPRRR